MLCISRAFCTSNHHPSGSAKNRSARVVVVQQSIRYPIRLAVPSSRTICSYICINYWTALFIHNPQIPGLAAALPPTPAGVRFLNDGEKLALRISEILPDQLLGFSARHTKPPTTGTTVVGFSSLCVCACVLCWVLFHRLVRVREAKVSIYSINTLTMTTEMVREARLHRMRLTGWASCKNPNPKWRPVCRVVHHHHQWCRLGDVLRYDSIDYHHQEPSFCLGSLRSRDAK